LHWAALMGDTNMAALLLSHPANLLTRDHRADINAQNLKGETPLRLALARNHRDLAQLLRDHGGHE